MIHWRDEYVARSEILQKVQAKFQAGLSDEAIAKYLGSDAETIWRLRTQYKFFRSGECPDCGCREYSVNSCPNKHCISVWPYMIQLDKPGKMG